MFARARGCHSGVVRGRGKGRTTTAMARRMIGAALALAMCFGAGPGALAQEIVLASHRAAYVLGLGAARAAAVAGIEGALTVELQETCDGWTLSQRMRFSVQDQDGDTVETDISFSSWEAADGNTMRFTMRSSSEGEVVEDIRGRAVLAGSGKGGKVVFTQPEEEVIELPPGTIFPTLHTIHLISRARAGERIVMRPVFDGSAVDGAYEVNALLGTASAPGAARPARPAPGVDAALLAGRSWPVRMAYFRMDDRRGAEPEYESSMRLFENGVAIDFRFEYPEFTIRGVLDRLEEIPRPRC
jgi:hypothetical protein